MTTDDVTSGFGELLGQLAATPDTTLPAFAVGERYVVVGALGEGGFGAVYEVHDTRDDRRVALKLLRRHNAEALYRFKREFRSLADLQHPGLVRLYELANNGEQWFLTMEHVDGVPFDTYLMRHPERLSASFRQLAEALVALHSESKLHRDLKPSNVLVESGGRVVVLDFGMVRELAADASTTFGGTPIYMSPEQCRHAPLSAASDWYAFGVMLYHALSGELPFDGPALTVISGKQLAEAPPLPDDVDPRWGPLAMRLLDRDPEARPLPAEVLAAFDGAAPERERRSEPPFIGREPELEALRLRFGALEAGHSSEVHVRAPSGIGKTSLIRHFLKEVRARPDVLVLEGRCYENESLPYKALDSVVDALAQHLTHMPAQEAAALLPRNVHALAGLFPTLPRVAAIATAPKRVRAIADPRELRELGFAALKELLERLGDAHQLVIAIDDAQWGDVDSARLLAEVFGPPNMPTALLLLAYRSDEVETSPMLRELLRDERPDTYDVELSGLGEDEARQLAYDLLGDGDEELATRIASESLGHPMLLSELVRHGGVGRTLPEMIKERAQAMDGPSQCLLRVICVAGHPLQPSVAIDASGVDGGEALERLRDGRLVRTRGVRPAWVVQPFHDSIRETIAAGVNDADTASLHLRIGEALERDSGAEPRHLATHFLAAGDKSRGREHALVAADRARAKSAFDLAAELGRMALGTMTPDDASWGATQEALAEALELAGRGAEAAEIYLTASTRHNGIEALELRRRAVQQFLITGHTDRGMEVATPLLEELGLSMPGSTRGILMAAAWELLLLRFRGLSLDQEENGSADPRARLRADLCDDIAYGLQFTDTLSGLLFVVRFTRRALDCGDREQAARALSIYAAGLSAAGYFSGELERALVLMDECAAQTGDARLQAVVSIQARAFPAAFDGHHARALIQLDEALTTLRADSSGVSREIGAAEAMARFCLWQMGLLERLVSRSERTRREAQRRGDRFEVEYSSWLGGFLDQLRSDNCVDLERFVPPLRGSTPAVFHVQNRCYTALYQGNAELVVDMFAEATKELKRLFIYELATWRAFLDLMLGIASLSVPNPDLRMAKRLMRRLERNPNLMGPPCAKVLRAGLARATGDIPACIALYGEASAAFDGVSMKLHAASCRMRLGALRGDDEGRVIVEEAESLMRAEGIVRPQKFSRLYAPFFPPLRQLSA